MLLTLQHVPCGLQGPKRPDDGIELLVIPQAGEVEADGSGGKVGAVTGGGEEPLDAGC